MITRLSSEQALLAVVGGVYLAVLLALIFTGRSREFRDAPDDSTGLWATLVRASWAENAWVAFGLAGVTYYEGFGVLWLIPGFFVGAFFLLWYLL